MYRQEQLFIAYSVVVDAMLKLLFVGVLFQVIRCQTLYESVFINDSFLYDGKEKELNILLDGCENKLREKVSKLRKGFEERKNSKASWKHQISLSWSFKETISKVKTSYKN